MGIGKPWGGVAARLSPSPSDHLIPDAAPPSPPAGSHTLVQGPRHAQHTGTPGEHRRVRRPLAPVEAPAQARAPAYAAWSSPRHGEGRGGVSHWLDPSVQGKRQFRSSAPPACYPSFRATRALQMTPRQHSALRAHAPRVTETAGLFGNKESANIGRFQLRSVISTVPHSLPSGGQSHPLITTVCRGRGRGSRTLANSSSPS